MRWKKQLSLLWGCTQESERCPIKAAALPAKSTSDQSTAGDMWDLPQKPGNDASRALHKPDCDQCEKRKWSRWL